MKGYLKVLSWACSLIIKRIARSAIIVEIDVKDVKLIKTNILSLPSKRHLQRHLPFQKTFAKCLLECKGEILAFTIFVFLILISTIIALLVILFIMKNYETKSDFLLDQ